MAETSVSRPLQQPRQSEQGSEALAQSARAGDAVRARVCCAVFPRPPGTRCAMFSTRSARTWRRWVSASKQRIAGQVSHGDDPDLIRTDDSHSNVPMNRGPAEGATCGKPSAPHARVMRQRFNSCSSADPKLARYGEPLHFAVREGHIDATVSSWRRCRSESRHRTWRGSDRRRSRSAARGGGSTSGGGPESQYLHDSG